MYMYNAHSTAHTNTHTQHTHAPLLLLRAALLLLALATGALDAAPDGVVFHMCT